MKAMVLREPAPIETAPLQLTEVAVPEAAAHDLLVRVLRCGVCRTDLHVAEGDLPPLRPGIVPGHEIVGTVAQVGSQVRAFSVGETVGVPWLHRTCGACEYCLSGRENLCDAKELTGYTVPGGYAEYVVADARYALRLPSGEPDPLAPLLCAGIIGYRALKLALPRPGGRIGFFGFGGSAHLALAVAAALGYETIAYSRSREHLALAERLGATETRWTGGPSSGAAPTLDAAVVFAPAGEVVVQALAELKKGGTVSIAAIHLSPIPALDYDRLLFGERRIVSVEANTRADAREFLDLASRLRLKSTVSRRRLSEANEALQQLKAGKVVGAVVLDCEHP
jgi:alcohol dehydrogenase, propanol-preferring